MVVVRSIRADAPVVFGVWHPGTEDFRFSRHLVGGGQICFAFAFDLHPDSAIDARASLVGVEGLQVALADAVENTGDDAVELEVNVGVEAFHDFVVPELGCSERHGGRAAVADAFRVEVRPVGEVEDRGVHGFFLLMVVAVIT